MVFTFVPGTSALALPRKQVRHGKLGPESEKLDLFYSKFSASFEDSDFSAGLFHSPLLLISMFSQGHLISVYSLLAC